MGPLSMGWKSMTLKVQLIDPWPSMFDGPSKFDSNVEIAEEEENGDFDLGF